MTGLLRRYTREEAERTILKRVPLDEFDVTPGVLQSIERLFGEPLSPEQAVRRVITDIREQGDGAVKRWMKTIDRVDLQTLEVPEAEFEQVSVLVNDVSNAVMHMLQAMHGNFVDRLPAHALDLG